MKTLMCIVPDPAHAARLGDALGSDYRTLQCPDPEDARRIASGCPPDLILVSTSFLASDGRPALEGLLELGASCPIVGILGPGEPQEVGNRGGAVAEETLPYGCTPEELRSAVARLLRHPNRRSSGMGSFVGSCAAMRRVEETLRLFAASDFPVLIVGESGTGKEIAARAIHRLSARSKGPFIARNCAALPDLLAESELFGTERGAFTDAIARPGAFELARHGVLFLDEIGEAGMGIQAKLLRVLETGEYWKLGAREPTMVDMRLISATGRDLDRASESGIFRADLRWRIDTLVLRMPPLRERPGDIPELAEHFALAASKGRMSLGSDALDKLATYSWPGNVRQLRNVVHRAIVLAARSDHIGPEHIQF